MTPMLDIVFIMLIFFIVTTSFVKETGVTVNKPEATQAVAMPRGNILIAVTAAGKIWVAKHEVQLADVREFVQRAKSENPEGSVVVIADKDAATGLVIQVMDQARLGGADNVAIAATRETD